LSISATAATYVRTLKGTPAPSTAEQQRRAAIWRAGRGDWHFRPAGTQQSRRVRQLIPLAYVAYMGEQNADPIRPVVLESFRTILPPCYLYIRMITS